MVAVSVGAAFAMKKVAELDHLPLARARRTAERWATVAGRSHAACS